MKYTKERVKENYTANDFFLDSNLKYKIAKGKDKDNTDYDEYRE